MRIKYNRIQYIIIKLIVSFPIVSNLFLSSKFLLYHVFTKKDLQNYHLYPIGSSKES